MTSKRPNRKKVLYSLQLNLKQPLLSGYVADSYQEAQELLLDTRAQSYELVKISTDEKGRQSLKIIDSKGELPEGHDIQMYYVNLYSSSKDRIVKRKYFNTYTAALKFAESNEFFYGVEIYKYEANATVDCKDSDVVLTHLASFAMEGERKRKTLNPYADNEVVEDYSLEDLIELDKSSNS